jgi:uncharacterized delta-60 repeat protein
MMLSVSRFPWRWLVVLLLISMLTTFAFRTIASPLNGGEYPTLDPNFPGDGITLVEPGDQNPAIELLQLPNGNTLTMSGTTGWLYMRLPNGQADVTFGTEGAARYYFLNELFRPRTATFGDSNQIILAGELYVSHTSPAKNPLGHDGFAMIRISNDGTLDTTFGTDGLVLIQRGTNIMTNTAHRIHRQTNGKFSVLVADTGSKPSGGLYQIEADGTLDLAFGGDGSIPYQLGRGVYDMVLTPQGVIIVGTDLSTPIRGFLERYRYTDGALDPTFGENGTRYLTFDGFTNSELRTIELTHDQKLVVAGNASTPSVYAVARLTTDGNLDPTFNGDGKVTFAYTGEIPSGQLAPYVKALALTPTDISIVANFDQDEGAIVANLTPNGLLDTTFGDGGFYANNRHGFKNANTLLATTDGGLVVGGERFGLGLLKLTAAGTADLAYGDVGYYAVGGYVPVSGGRWLPHPTGGYLTVARQGENFFGSNATGTLLLRTTISGTVDSTYGTDGVAVVPTPSNGGNGSDPAIGVAIDASGRTFLSGYVNTGFQATDAVLTRLTATGTVDSTFGTNGFLTIGPPNREEAYALAIDAENHLLVAGRLRSDSEPQAVTVRRLTLDGVSDSTFGTNGVVTIPNCPTEFYLDRTRQTWIQTAAGGDIFVVVYCQRGDETSGTFAYRFNSDGLPDMTYGTNGIANVPLGLNDISIAPDGTLTFVGSRGNGNQQYWRFARLTPQGEPDITIGPNGIVEHQVPVLLTTLIPMALAQQVDGKWLLLGSSILEDDSSATHHHLVRLEANGTLDSTFGTDGFAQFNLAYGDYPNDLILTDFGALLTGAYNYNRASNQLALTVIRLLVNEPLPTPTATPTNIPPTPTATLTPAPQSRTLYLPLTQRGN